MFPPMTTRWAFFVDESGNFEDPGDTVAVSGLLLHDRASLQPHTLKAALRRAAPLLPWPPHAWLLDQPAFIAVAIREAGKRVPISGDSLMNAALGAWQAMKR